MRHLSGGFLSLFFVLAYFGLSFAADTDLKGSKDHPLVSRMPNFHITEYKNTAFDSYQFLNHNKQKLRRQYTELEFLSYFLS